MASPLQQLMNRLGSMPKVRPGNIDLYNRPSVPNVGGRSSVYSMTFPLPGGQAILLPGVIKDAKGRWTIGNFQQAWAYYKKTGQHLGVFANEAQANQYANALHHQQEAAGLFPPLASAGTFPNVPPQQGYMVGNRINPAFWNPRPGPAGRAVDYIHNYTGLRKPLAASHRLERR
jgi:hypothetical protein